MDGLSVTLPSEALEAVADRAGEPVLERIGTFSRPDNPEPPTMPRARAGP